MLENIQTKHFTFIAVKELPDASSTTIIDYPLLRSCCPHGKISILGRGDNSPMVKSCGWMMGPQNYRVGSKPLECLIQACLAETESGIPSFMPLNV